MKMNLSSTARVRLKKLTPSPITLLLLGLIVYVWFRPGCSGDVTDGRTPHLSPLHGKVFLVNFWATWCLYCGHEMPSFYRDWHSRGFEILALPSRNAADI